MEKENKGKYEPWHMVCRMFSILKEEKPIQISRMVIYAVAAGLFFFF